MIRSLVFRTLITNSAIMGLGLVNSVLLSRWLGPTGRGEIAAAMLWPTLLVYLSSIGLISSTLYFAALPESRPQPILANATVLAAIQSVVALIIGYAALPLLLHSQTATVVTAGRLYLLVIPLSLWTQYGLSILQGRMHISAFNWLRTIIPVGYLAGSVILMSLGRLTLMSIVILHIVLSAIVLMVTFAVLFRSSIYPFLGTDVGLAKQMIKYGAKVHVGNVSGLANLSLDQVLMAAWLPPAYLGLYVVAVSSAAVSQVFSQAVQMVLTPNITKREFATERAAVLQEVFRRYWVLSLLITLAIAVALPVALPVTFGVSFKDALWPAEVLFSGALFIGAKEVLAGGAQALGDPWLGSKAHISAVVVTALLLYVLLPTMGIMGAAIATSLAYGTQLLIVLFGLQKSHAIPARTLFHVRASDLSALLRMFGTAEKRKNLVPDQS